MFKHSLFIILVISMTSAFAFKRKKEQFLKTPSYLIAPAPYQLPGIGSGWIFYGRINNFALDYMDMSAYLFTGAVQGEGMGLHELHLIDEHFYFGGSFQNVREASLQTYYSRGTQDHENDYFFLNGSDIEQRQIYADLTFWNRRLNFNYTFSQNQYALDNIISLDGDKVSEFDFSEGDVVEANQRFTFFLDLTNDFQDPTMGFRFKLTKELPNTNKSLSDSEYNIISQSYNLYIPVLSFSTLALNFFKSDAYVSSEGLTDDSAIRQRLGLNDCSTLSSELQAECQTVQNKIISRVKSQNLAGSAQGLGGRDRMRGYIQDRFTGSHTLYYAGEFRYNLDNSIVPFNFFLIKDTRSAFQIAFFYEEGASSDNETSLPDELRVSKGIGLRMVANSGFVFRGDWGHSDEGNQYTLIASYPW